MPDLKKTLDERKSVYGDYSKLSEFRAELMSKFKLQYLEHHEEEMKEIDSLCIFDIVNKLCRLAITPDHIDSWHDIAGYATIIEKFYKEKQDADKQ